VWEEPDAVAVRLGAALRAERRAQGLRQDDVALAGNLGRRAVGYIERGNATGQLRTWLKVADALGLRLSLTRDRGWHGPAAAGRGGGAARRRGHHPQLPAGAHAVRCDGALDRPAQARRRGEGWSGLRFDTAPSGGR
jgi:transcriptional regulator with XRE-family HTH domain